MQTHLIAVCASDERWEVRADRVDCLCVALDMTWRRDGATERVSARVEDDAAYACVGMYQEHRCVELELVAEEPTEIAAGLGDHEIGFLVALRTASSRHTQSERVFVSARANEWMMKSSDCHRVMYVKAHEREAELSVAAIRTPHAAAHIHV